ncbi:hypothetical protein Pan216_01750 [Planctomycetes bacterium Pan216]|uniref:Uncharacterized protein n=1 Tax=Kolteria novifilia TaxID=2527975 RepID=A0A518AX85_9BACT|nr:hypothetical protein Pan216_01750 [Planctomycetes bacterium Pan216]
MSQSAKGGGIARWFSRLENYLFLVEDVRDDERYQHALVQCEDTRPQKSDDDYAWVLDCAHIAYRNQVERLNQLNLKALAMLRHFGVGLLFITITAGLGSMRYSEWVGVLLLAPIFIAIAGGYYSMRSLRPHAMFGYPDMEQMRQAIDSETAPEAPRGALVAQVNLATIGMLLTVEQREDDLKQAIALYGIAVASLVGVFIILVIATAIIL